MEILFLVLMGLILLALAGMVLGNEETSKLSWELHKACIAGFCAYAIIGFINLSKPTAMDVYRGRTTLEITYKDSVAIDSVVVFKDKEE